jgi:SAM-dependent methyltransferase
VIASGGFERSSIWEHSESLRDLYTRRCRLEVEEMTAHAQAAELLEPYVAAGDTLLDAGCGSGYFFHSLRNRSLPVAYHGIDASATLVEIGRRELAPFGLPPERLQTLRIEDLQGEADHVVCVNVLSNVDNYHRPLERLLQTARKTLVLRESLGEQAEYLYVQDRFLDEGVDLKVYVNTYAVADVLDFVDSYGFDARAVVDRRSGGEPELVIGYPHRWTFVVATRRSS